MDSLQVDKSTQSKEKYDIADLSKLLATLPITAAKDMSIIVYIEASIVNVILKSRVRENRKHGSVGVGIIMKF